MLCCVAAGVLAGALSALLTRAVYAAEDAFLRLPIHWMWWPAIGGLVVGLGGLVYPRALGVGYDVIEALLTGKLVGWTLLLLVAVKGTIWAVSLGSGTSGGVLAPLLIMGAALGGLEAQVFPAMGIGFWPLIGMGAILGGTMRSPLTGVVFALELTHDVSAMLPLLVAVSVAHAFTVLVLRRSILTEKVSRRGFHLTREYATDPLEILFVREVMGAAVMVLPAGASREELAASLDKKRHEQRLFAVVDERGDLLGVVTRGDLHRWASGSDDAAGPQTLGNIARSARTAFPDEPLRLVVNRMAETGLTRLPVVERDNPKKMVGEVTLEHLLKARVRHLEEERRRERVLPLQLVVPRWLRSSSSVPASTRKITLATAGDEVSGAGPRG
jgi:CBS domain-containing protein